MRVAAKCPVCSKQVAAEYRPFCSKRCADIDLGRWLKEGYRVETEEAPIEEIRSPRANWTGTLTRPIQPAANNGAPR